MEFYATLGENCEIQDHVILGFKYKEDCKRTRIGDNAIIRSFSIIYADVVIGNDLKTGHGIIIRADTQIGSHIVIGTGVVIEGNVKIGDRVKIEAHAYIPTHKNRKQCICRTQCGVDQ